MLNDKNLTIRSRKVAIPIESTLVTEDIPTEKNVGDLVGLHISMDFEPLGTETICVKDKNGRDIIPQLPLLRHKNNVTGTFLSTVIPCNVQANGEKITVEIIAASNEDTVRNVWVEQHYKL